MPILGQHLIAEYYDCATHLVQNAAYMEQALLSAAVAAKAEPVHLTWRYFEPYGISGILIIAQSHVSIHTWPEHSFVSADFFTCGSESSAWLIYLALKSALQSRRTETYFHYRGVLGQQQPVSFLPQGKLFQLTLQQQNQRPDHLPGLHERWFMSQSPPIQMSMRFDEEPKPLHSVLSPFQKISVFQPNESDTLLVLNDLVVASSQDEFIFHEMLVHFPLFAHPSPKSVLLLGAGEGGSLLELLKHERISRIEAQEPDKMLFEVGKYLFRDKSNAFQKAEYQGVLQLSHAGTADFLAIKNEYLYDVVLLDAVDTALQDVWLESIAFFQKIEALLCPNGLFVMPLPSPILHKEAYQTVLYNVKQAFSKEATGQSIFEGSELTFDAKIYQAAGSAFSGGLHTWLCVRKQGNEHWHFEAKIFEKFCQKHKLRYFNAAIFESAQKLPNIFYTFAAK